MNNIKPLQRKVDLIAGTLSLAVAMQQQTITPLTSTIIEAFQY